VDVRKKVLEALSEIGRSRASLTTFERQLEMSSEVWLRDLREKTEATTNQPVLTDVQLELASTIESLLNISGSTRVNTLLGKAITHLIELERLDTSSSNVMRRLLTTHIADMAASERKRLLVINPISNATYVAVFEGIERIHSTNLHLSLDCKDGVGTRVGHIQTWLDEIGVELDSFSGIACQGGFLNPVPSGIYPVVPEMLRDLENPAFHHAANMAIFIAYQLAEMSGRKNDMTLITRDPVVTDEVELAERITGLKQIKLDGTGAHYLNHKAVWRLLGAMVGRDPISFDAVTAFIGGGTSIVAHRAGQATAVVNALSGIPSASRCGNIDLRHVLDGMSEKILTVKELNQAINGRGGLLSLAGTNDLTMVIDFMRREADETQRRKIEALLDFFAKRIAAFMLKLTADNRGTQAMILTGSLANTQELVGRVERYLGNRYPVIRIPGSIENESLAAGLLTAIYEPQQVSNYRTERNTLHKRRKEENALIDTTIMKREILFRRPGAPITSLPDIIDAARITVKDSYLPTIGIIGADNEEAILAAKRANEGGHYRIAKFMLIGDFNKINRIAYEVDLVIDNDNYVIVDTDDPVAEGMRLLSEGAFQIPMKGGVHTEDILRGTFRYLKENNKINKGDVISHVAIVDIPTRNKLLAFSDGAVNTYPDATKRIAMLENALKVVHNLNIAKPKVAVISAIETVNRSVESSIEAETIAQHFAGRDDCIVEGPLSIDVSMDPRIAEEKHYKGEVKGNADLLILPDIDAGNVLWKTLTTQSGASIAGVIMCSDMPLVLTSRGDSAQSKLASLALAVKLYHDMHQK